VINWPDRFHPTRAPVHVVNSHSIPAPCEQVWAWLIRAPLWPTWYPNSSNVRLLDPSQNELGPGTSFTWQTFGVRIKSTVREFVPHERLAWDARSPGVDAYHAWLLLAEPNGTRVITEETQYGLLARLQQLFMPRRMERGHQLWLEKLSERAQTGFPRDSESVST
jgi:uncharacterized protein YndB with AHSA1/START domain